MKMLPRHRTARSWRKRQRGAVAIIVGLLMVVLIGFIGLALDGGHLYLTKTELQNGADACALAASYELTDAPSIPSEAFLRAESAGKYVGNRNSVNFQGAPISQSDIEVHFGTSLNGGAWVEATSASGASKYVRCTIQETGIAPWFMQVLGFGPQTVRALATATLSPAQTNCALPMGLCTLPGASAPNYGYVPTTWYGLDFQDTGGVANYTGNFRWIDFDPSAPTPGCPPSGGASELACLIAGTGQCSVPPPISGGCSTSGNSTPTPGCVGQSGNITSLEVSYNSRFGVYKNGAGNPQPTTAPPDLTGKAYAWEGPVGSEVGNWPAAANALGDFLAARTAHESTADVAGLAPSFIPPSYHATYPPDHATYGADRRIVTLPIVDCTSFTGGGTHAPIRAYACVMLLDTYRKLPGGEIASKIEYIGPANDPGSPCASSGVSGSSTSPGPLVPTLVQ